MPKSAPSTYLQYLPAIFQRKPASEQESTPFLGQFLRPFEDVIGSIEAVLAVVDHSFSAALAPAEDFLPWLASWIALVLDEDWSEDRQRRLLAEAMQLYQWRGTVAGLKRYVEIYADVEPEAIDIREGRQPAGMQIGVSSRIGAVQRNGPGASTLPLGEVRTESRDYYFVDTLASSAESPSAVSAAAATPGGLVRFVYPADWVQRIAFEKDGLRLWYAVPAPGGSAVPAREVFHPYPDGTGRKPSITRCNGLIDFVVARSAPGSGGIETLRGGAFLIEEIDAPYRFIVNVKARGPMFRADCDSVNKLDAGMLSPQLREQFSQARIFFTERALVKVQQEGRAWMVVDAMKEYLIRLEDKKHTKFIVYDPKAQLPPFDKVIKRLHAVLDAERPAHTLYYLKITPMARESRRRFMQVGVRSSIGADTLLS
jgi:phage tail-like protein